MTRVLLCARCRAGVVVEAACANCGVRHPRRGLSAREFDEINRRIALALVADGVEPRGGPRAWSAAECLLVGALAVLLGAFLYWLGGGYLAGLPV